MALRRLVQQQNVSSIPKASSRTHQKANLAVFDFELSDAEMAEIFDLQGGMVDRLRSRLGV